MHAKRSEWNTSVGAWPWLAKIEQPGSRDEADNALGETATTTWVSSASKPTVVRFWLGPIVGKSYTACAPPARGKTWSCANEPEPAAGSVTQNTPVEVATTQRLLSS